MAHPIVSGFFSQSVRLSSLTVGLGVTVDVDVLIMTELLLVIVVLVTFEIFVIVSPVIWYVFVVLIVVVLPSGFLMTCEGPGRLVGPVMVGAGA